MKKITSLTAFLSFLITLLTSIILYIVPHGRVAYWSDWKLWALSKEQWGAIHINVGFLFLLALLLHIYYNWKLIISYLKNRAKKITIFTKEFNIALILTALFIVGTYAEIPPFSTILNISGTIKEAATKKYGEPPYGHAELSSLKIFTKRMDIDLKKTINSLQEAGFKVDSETQTLQDIASKNRVSPHTIYLSMPIHRVSDKTTVLPKTPPQNTGNLTLLDFCTQYNLNLTTIIESLKKLNIESKADMTIKEIGKTNNRSPIDIYEEIKSAISKNEKNTPK